MELNRKFKMKNLVISIIYFLIGIIAVILLEQTSFYPGFFAKCMIIPALIVMFTANLNPLSNRLHMFILAGLFFSWAGDITLEFTHNNELFFLLGLVCFLLAHIMYLIVFFGTPGYNSILGNRVYLVLPVLIYGIALVSYLYRDLADMRMPVILYAAVILSMLTGAINRKDKVNTVSYYFVLTGAVLFVISDSAIAVNRFSHQFRLSGIVIMSTYIVAQYFIVKGYIYQYRK
jgi:uncharacterized membrane protein YhhN